MENSMYQQNPYVQQPYYGGMQQQQYPPYIQQQMAQQQQMDPNQGAMKQLLTAPEVAKLKKNPTPPFNSKLNEEEFLKAICTHKCTNPQTGEGQMALVYDQSTGMCKCTVCQEEFRMLPLDISTEEVRAIINNFYNLMQTIKTYYTNPPMSLREFFAIVGFIPKIEQIWHIAKNYYSKSLALDPAYNAAQQANDPFAVVGSALNANLTAFQPFAAQPYYPPQQPMMQQQPPYNMQQPQPGYYAQQPQPAMMQTPQQPMMQQPPPYNMQPYPTQPPQQQGSFYTPANLINNPPPSTNPVGYVEQPQQQQTTSQAGQPQNLNNQPPLPPAPTNPNIKADVGKKFEG